MTREILSFPEHIRTVPPLPVGPNDPAWVAKREAYQVWSNDVLRYRLTRRQDIEKHPQLQSTELEYCARDAAHWLLTWGRIFEPRPMRDKLPDMPFLLYPFQIDLLDWFETLLETDGAKGDGVVSKSRDMGASWLMAAFALHGWLFRSPWQVQFVSWRADEVDARHANSIFWKVDYLLKAMPKWMLPKGFDWEIHRAKMLLINPENGNALVGQASTERAMRGGRSTWIGYDEAAINKSLEESWASTANVTYHRIAVSSEHLEFNDFFYRLRTGKGMDEGARPSLKELDYWLHPGHDGAWLIDQQDRNSAVPGAFEREVLRDPRAGTSTFVYTAANDKIPMQIMDLSGVPAFVGIDPGHSDECAIVWEQLHPDGRVKVMDAHQRKGMTADFWGTILRGTPFIRTTNELTPEDIALFDSGMAHDLGSDVLASKGWARVGLGDPEPDGHAESWTYSPQELSLMHWVRRQGKATYYGDISGNSTVGATKDTVYTRLARRFGIRVNVDRLRDGKIVANRMMARQHKGRIEALKEALPRMDFANTWGARMALNALQEYRWTEEDKPRAYEPKVPEHTRESHLVTAMEYIAVHRFIRQLAETNPPRKPYRSGANRAPAYARMRAHG